MKLFAFLSLLVILFAATDDCRVFLSSGLHVRNMISETLEIRAILETISELTKTEYDDEEISDYIKFTPLKLFNVEFWNELSKKNQNYKKMKAYGFIEYLLGQGATTLAYLDKDFEKIDSPDSAAVNFVEKCLSKGPLNTKDIHDTKTRNDEFKLLYTTLKAYRRDSEETSRVYFYITFSSDALIELKKELTRSIVDVNNSLNAKNNEVNSRLDQSIMHVAQKILQPKNAFPLCYLKSGDSFACLCDVSMFVFSVIGKEFPLYSENPTFSYRLFKEVKKFVSKSPRISEEVLDNLKMQLSPLKEFNLKLAKVLNDRKVYKTLKKLRKFGDMFQGTTEQQLTMSMFGALLSDLVHYSKSQEYHYVDGIFTAKSPENSEIAADINLRFSSIFNNYDRVKIIQEFIETAEHQQSLGYRISEIKDYVVGKIKKVVV